MRNVSNGLFLVLVLAPAVAHGAVPALTAVDSGAAGQVADGVRREASAAWWGFDEHDATTALQSAIDSNAPRVVVPHMGKPWIIRPIRLRSNLELFFEPGVLVLAKEGEFKGKGDSLFSARDAENIAIRGYGATLRMRKADYQSEAYERAEWRMTVSLQGCRNVAIEGVRLEASGGDGVYIGATGALPYCAGVTIRDVVCDGHHRQGISVISAVDLLIENCLFSNTGGTAPRAGIDLEPNSPNEKLVNCVIRNCAMEANEGAGILLYLKPLSNESDPVSVLFENCHVRSGKDAGIGVGALGDSGPGGVIEFRGCTIENTGKAGLYAYDKSPDAARVRFVECRWQNTWAGAGAEQDTTRAPLMLHVRRTEIAKSIGGFEFKDCVVHDTGDRAALLVEEGPEGLGARDLSGRIFVSNPHGAKADVGPHAEGIALDVVPFE